MKVKKGLAIAASVAVLIGAAACSPPSSSDTVSGESLQGQTITWWATNQAASVQQDQQIWQPILDEFTKENGVKVNFEVNTWGTYYNRILGAISSGEGADLMNVGTTWTGPLTKSGAFLQLDQPNLDAAGGAAQFVKSSFQAAGGDNSGGPSFVPLMSTVNSLWYNPKMFAAAGIPKPPATFTEFIADAQKLTKDTNGDGKIDQWGFGYPAGFGQELAHSIFAFGAQDGGTLYGSSGSPTLDSAGLVDATKAMTDLMTVQKVMSTADVESTSTAAEYQEFVQGRTAMFFGASPQSVFQSAGFTDYANAPLPVMDPLKGTPVMSHVAGANVGVFAATKHKAAALAFLKYLTSAPVQVKVANAFQVMPVNQQAYSSSEVKKDAVFNVRADIIANHAASWPINATSAQAETMLGNALQQLFAKAALSGPLSEATVKDALAKANAQLAAAG